MSDRGEMHPSDSQYPMPMRVQRDRLTDENERLRAENTEIRMTDPIQLAREVLDAKLPMPQLIRLRNEAAPALAQAVMEQAEQLELWRTLHGADDARDSIVQDMRGKEKRVLSALASENTELRRVVGVLKEIARRCHGMMELRLDGREIDVGDAQQLSNNADAALREASKVTKGAGS